MVPYDRMSAWNHMRIGLEACVLSSIQNHFLQAVIFTYLPSLFCFTTSVGRMSFIANSGWKIEVISS